MVMAVIHITQLVKLRTNRLASVSTLTFFEELEKIVIQLESMKQVVCI